MKNYEICKDYTRHRRGRRRQRAAGFALSDFFRIFVVQ